MAFFIMSNDRREPEFWDGDGDFVGDIEDAKAYETAPYVLIDHWGGELWLDAVNLRYYEEGRAGNVARLVDVEEATEAVEIFYATGRNWDDCLAEAQLGDKY